MIVRPSTPGAVIRDPHTKRPLPAKGGRVPDTNYWRRRLMSGDVVLVTELAEQTRGTPRDLAPTTPLQTRGSKSDQ